MPVVIGATAIGLLVLMVLIGAISAVMPGGRNGAQEAMCPTKPPEDIPPHYLALYQRAATRYGIPWQLLAAVGKVESDHGRGSGPGIRSGTNYAGAAGPMQFMPATWKAFGVDGDEDGKKNIYDPADAIPAAASYLKRNGAPKHIERALWWYNHDTSYVQKVLDVAETYTAPPTDEGCALVAFAGAGRGADAVRAAMRWLGTPYSWGGGGLKGPTRGIGQGRNTIGFDCSGLTRYAWHQAGVSIPRIAADQWRRLPRIPPGRHRPGDLVFFRSSGSSHAPGHVGLVVGKNKMIEAPRTGLKVRVTSINNRRDVVGYARPVPRAAAR